MKNETMLQRLQLEKQEKEEKIKQLEKQLTLKSSNSQS